MSTWIILVYGLVCLLVGIVSRDIWTTPAVDISATTACYEQFDDYVKQQNEWMKIHNAELQSIVELKEHNNKTEAERKP
jgi:hypothetical protein